MKTDDMIGKRFGKWLVLSKKTEGKKVKVLCRCDCGNEKYVSAYAVHSGHSKSCCGVSYGRMKHGMSKAKIYGIWLSMKNRCHNPKVEAYKYYGERGICVCERWKDFESFYKGMGDKPKGKSLERVDNSKGYSPGNCVWATPKEQARNKRGLRMATAGGETKSLGEWAEVTGLSVGTLWNRLNLGWTDDEAVNTPKVMRRRSAHKRDRMINRRTQ